MRVVYAIGVIAGLVLVVALPCRADPIAAATAGPAVTAGQIPVWFDASTSTPGSPSSSIDLYEWDFDADGTFDYSSTSASARHVFADWDHATAIFRTNVVTLRVTDSLGGQGYSTVSVLQTTDSWSSSYANQAPVADAGGPYLVEIGDGLSLDGTDSYDPDAGHVAFGDTIMEYEWSIYRSGSWQALATGATPYLSPSDHVWLSTMGDYTLGLRVTDRWDAYGYSPLGSPYIYTSILVQVRPEGWGAAVPEPVSAALFGFGAGILALRRRRKKVRTAR